MLPKHTPRSCTVPRIEQITTPNKNIQSYFMRSDVSYYADEKHRMENYRGDEQVVHVMVWGSRLVVECEGVDLGDFFRLTGMNTGRFGGLEECVGWLGNKVKEVLDRLGIVGKESFVSLVVHDLLSRTEVLALCNLFINVLLFKGILVTPRSLSQALGTLSPNCVVVNLYERHTTICLVEDFWMLDGVSVSEEREQGFNLIDSVDFVDEFSRVKVYEEKNVYWCNKCDHKDESESRMEAHFGSVHGGDVECHPGVDAKEHARMHTRMYEEGGDIHEVIAKRMGYVLSMEKMRKVGSKVVVFGCGGGGVSEERLRQVLGEYGVDAEVAVYDDPSDDMILSVMRVFAELECAKEMWMTDKEWNGMGLRILKEKVLFII